MTNRLDHFDVSIITPKECTNLVSNPSFELNTTTGYTAGGAGVSIAASTTSARRGLYSCEVTTASGVDSAVYYTTGTLTAATQYTFSVDVKDIAGQPFFLKAYELAGDNTEIVGTIWTGTGYWNRRSLTFTAEASTYAIQVIRQSVVSTTKFYVDGFQLEVGAVPSTYFDGDMVGFVPGQTDYRWNGSRHASTSYRSRETRSGGIWTHISDYARILQIPGLGMSPVSNIAIPSTMGGSFYQNTIPVDRPFSIICNINKANDLGLVEVARQALINAVRPDYVTRAQPLLMQIDQLDSSSDPIAETLQVVCSYDGGLEWDGSESAYHDKIKLDFTCYDPYLHQDGEQAKALTYYEDIANANCIIKQSFVTGQWSALATGVDARVRAMVTGPDGSIYVAGNFMGSSDATSDQPSTDCRGIAKWDGNSWIALSTGLCATSDEEVYALAIAPDGTLYAGGTFLGSSDATSDQPSTDCAHIAKWDGASWIALANGLDDDVWALLYGADGNLYAGGDFVGSSDATSDQPSTDCFNIAKWNGSSWLPLGNGAGRSSTDSVRALAWGPDSYLYVGGQFVGTSDSTTDQPSSDCSHIAKWDGDIWYSLGTGISSTGGEAVYSISFGPDNSLYAGGTFTNMGGISALNVAKWTGTSWSALGSGVGVEGSKVYKTFADIDGSVIAAGNGITTAGGITVPDQMARWNGSSWQPLAIDLPSTDPIVYDICRGLDNTLYLGYSATGTATGNYSNTLSTIVYNAGSAITYPKIYFTGPGTVWQIENFTTHQRIFFNNLSLLDSEIAVLDLNPKYLSFYSSYRGVNGEFTRKGNIINKILPGSDLNFQLRTGTNYIALFIHGLATSDTGAHVVWQDTFWSIDGAVR